MRVHEIHRPLRSDGRKILDAADNLVCDGGYLFQFFRGEGAQDVIDLPAPGKTVPDSHADPRPLVGFQGPDDVFYIYVNI